MRTGMVVQCFGPFELDPTSGATWRRADGGPSSTWTVALSALPGCTPEALKASGADEAEGHSFGWWGGVRSLAVSVARWL